MMIVCDGNYCLHFKEWQWVIWLEIIHLPVNLITFPVLF